MKTAPKISCDAFFNQFREVSEAISVLLDDVSDLDIDDSVINKLLRLASCKSSTVGEKTNAGRAAFKRIQTYF